MSQKDWIITQLKTGRRLTQQTALLEYGIGRLASRIDELRKVMPEIVTEIKTVTKASGKKARIAEYYIPREEQMSLEGV